MPPARGLRHERPAYPAALLRRLGLPGRPLRRADADRAVPTRDGVPMGADLPAPGRRRAHRSSSRFAASDPGTRSQHPAACSSASRSSRAGSTTTGGLHQQVSSTWLAATTARASTATPARPTGPGATTLCGVWRDPEFDSERSAPSTTRGSSRTRAVATRPRSAWHFDERTMRPSGCDHSLMQAIQQERAWTSPIWYTPEG